MDIDKQKIAEIRDSLMRTYPRAREITIKIGLENTTVQAVREYFHEGIWHQEKTTAIIDHDKYWKKGGEEMKEMKEERLQLFVLCQNDFPLAVLNVETRQQADFICQRIQEKMDSRGETVNAVRKVRKAYIHMMEVPLISSESDLLIL